MAEKLAKDMHTAMNRQIPTCVIAMSSLASAMVSDIVVPSYEREVLR